MAREVRLGDRLIGDGHPAYVIAEVGINHNGDIEIARSIIDAAVHAGADAVKFQKRTPAVSTRGMGPEEMRKIADMIDRVLSSQGDADLLAIDNFYSSKR